jgi:hypothetical protein
MSVWFCIPSAKPVPEAIECLGRWRSMGYKTAVIRDQEDCVREWNSAEGLTIIQPYKGYARSVNELAALVLRLDEKCDWIVTGGDDTLPDPNKRADEIAEECSNLFAGRSFRARRERGANLGHETGLFSSTFGVMQPTGDRWGGIPQLPEGHPHRGPYIERVAGSPWLGREWCERMYGGDGPLWHGWRHMFVDQELQEVALRLGVLWQRPDLVQYHNHYARTPGTKPPPYILHAVSAQHWAESQALFSLRKAAGFPGHEPKVA